MVERCAGCGWPLPVELLRQVSDGHVCRPCDTDGGDDWHANEWWINNKPRSFMHSTKGGDAME